MSRYSVLTVAEPVEPVRRDLWIWPVLLALGWLLYELTMQPNLGAAVVCLKFGWEDFMAAQWLLRTDPQRRRGWACFWLCFSSGLWKAAVTASLAILVFALLGGIRPIAPLPAQAMRVPAWLEGVLVTGFTAFGLSTIASGIAFGLARRHHLKLWLSSGVYLARRRKTWPPLLFTTGQKNWSRLLLYTAFSLVTGTASLFIFGLLLVAAIKGRAGPPLVIALFLICMVAVPICLLKCLDRLSKGLIARTPWECWPPDSYAEPPDLEVYAP